MAPARVLLVDDDLEFIRRAQAAFSARFELRVVSTRDAAISAAGEWQPNVVILDVLLADADAFRLLDDIRARCTTRTSIICLARGAGCRTYVHDDGIGFFGVVSRDAGPAALRSAVDRVTRGGSRCAGVCG